MINKIKRDYYSGSLETDQLTGGKTLLIRMKMQPKLTKANAGYALTSMALHEISFDFPIQECYAPFKIRS